MYLYPLLSIEYKIKPTKQEFWTVLRIRLLATDITAKLPVQNSYPEYGSEVLTYLGSYLPPS